MNARNPWDQGMLAVAGLLAISAVLFIIGLLAVLAVGVQLTEEQNPDARYFAWVMLAIIGAGAFVGAMSARWNRRH